MNSESLHFQQCLACGQKTLIYPNGFCPDCRLKIELKRFIQERELIEHNAEIQEIRENTLW